MADQLKDWKELAAQLRVDSIRCTTAAGSGHPTSCMSAADLMAVLLSKYLRYDWSNPHHPNNDRLIFSKGHACPLLYAMYKAAGAITDEELLTLRKFGSRLEGHPNPHVLPYVDVATGSLGQGLPIGVGMALNGKYLDKLPYRVWVVLGDSEMAEGSIWEAFDKASYYKLNNLIGILDMNRLGQRGETDLGWNSAAYAARARAFGWHAIELDGHDLDGHRPGAMPRPLTQKDQPTLPDRQDGEGHGVSVRRQQGRLARQGADRRSRPRRPSPSWAANATSRSQSHKPEDKRPALAATAQRRCKLPTYSVGQQGGDAQGLRRRAGRRSARTGPTWSRSTPRCPTRRTPTSSRRRTPTASSRCSSPSSSCSAPRSASRVLGKKAFASTFAAFFTRAYDQIRMAAVSNATIHLCGSHAGVSIGEDGPSQMALEDLAMMRAVCGSTVLYPCDANQTAAPGPPDGRPDRASPSCARRARRRRSSTRPARSSRSAAARW